MRRLKIVFHEDAIQDLEEIWFYTFKTWSLEQADHYHNLIFKEIEILARKPNLGKDVSYLKEGYRSAKIKSHIIFYKISSSSFDIVRILHEQMDIPNRLLD